jgi:SAM-dependent methyltransferase
METPLWLKQWRIHRKIDYFKSHGWIPWSRGYEEYKQAELSAALANPKWNPTSLPLDYGLNLDERIVEIPWFISSLPSGPGRLLDAGSSLNHELVLKHPRLAEKKIHICTLAPERECFWKRGISYLFEDLRALPYRDGFFDYVACISTLEHVGMDNTLHYTSDACFRENTPSDTLLVIQEFARILRPGGRLFFTVPFGRPVSHHWLRIFGREDLQELLRVFPAKQTAISVCRYSGSGWQPCPMEEAADAIFFDVHAGTPWTPSQPASAGAVCCIDLHKTT